MSRSKRSAVLYLICGTSSKTSQPQSSSTMILAGCGKSRSRRRANCHPRISDVIRALSLTSLSVLGYGGLLDDDLRCAGIKGVRPAELLHGPKTVGTLSSGTRVSHGAEMGGEEEEEAAAGCRVAVLYSGHVRSFAHPRVHVSHVKNLIEPLEMECNVDVFMYLAVEDQVPVRKGMGKFADRLAFAPYTPQKAAVHEAVQLFEPVSLVFHQNKQDSSLCDIAGCHENTFGQLYKMKAVYRMMEKHEAETSTRYTWVIRSRPDVGWMSRMPPLSRFPPTRVYAGHNFFPLADQFLLVPRQFAETLFGAVRVCYACDVLKAQFEAGVPAQTEKILRLALRQAGIPFGFFEFPIVIVRHKEGGVCSSLHPYKMTCQMLDGAGLIDGEACVRTVYAWFHRACAEMFPPLDTLQVPRITRTRTTTTTTTTPTTQLSTQAAALVTFEDATRKLEGVPGSLRDLSLSIKVAANPSRSVKPYFVAHHYPFNKVDDADSHDEIAVMAGFVLSMEDFNRLALALACALDAAAGGNGPESQGETEGFTDSSGIGAQASIRREDTPLVSSPPPTTINLSASPTATTTTKLPPTTITVDAALLVLRTTAPDDRLQAKVNCSLVDSLQGISLTLLDREFEPSETVCRGIVGPCLDRVSQDGPPARVAAGEVVREGTVD